MDEFFRTHPRCEKKFKQSHLIPGGPSLYDQVRNKAYGVNVINMATAGADWLSQSPSSLGWIPGTFTVPNTAALSSFMGTETQRVPGIIQLDGYADVAHNRIFIGVPINSAVLGHSDPVNVTMLHEVLHFLFAGEGDTHGNWDAILGATPRDPSQPTTSSGVLDEWLKDDCPKRRS